MGGMLCGSHSACPSLCVSYKEVTEVDSTGHKEVTEVDSTDHLLRKTTHALSKD